MEPMGLEEVVRHMREGAYLLRFAIDTGVFPEALLHTFACDCAQRALLWDKHYEVDTDKNCWKATGIKRLWIEKKKEKDELAGIHKTVRKIAEETDNPAAWAAAWASAEQAMLAARCAAHYGSAAVKKPGQENPPSYIWNLEKLWQRGRFLWLCDAWSEGGDETPQLLRQSSPPIEEAPEVQFSAGIPD